MKKNKTTIAIEKETLRKIKELMELERRTAGAYIDDLVDRTHKRVILKGKTND